MSKPKDQNERLLRIILVSWFLILLLIGSIVTYGTIEISKIKQNYVDLANREPVQVKNVETQLQPIYTTIQGKEGKQGTSGSDGKDSVSTSTTTIIHTEDQIQGPQGEAGTNGKPGRNVELGYNPDTNTWYQRYVGSEDWTPITIIGVQ